MSDPVLDVALGSQQSSAAGEEFREQLKWGSLNQKFADVLNSNERPADRPPAGRQMHRIELIEGAAPRFAPRYRTPLQHEEEIERQMDELLRKGKILACLDITLC